MVAPILHDDGLAVTDILIDGWNCGFIGGGDDNFFGYRDGHADGRIRVKLSTVTRPSETIITGDTTDWVGTDGGAWDYCYIYNPSVSPNTWCPSPSAGNRHSRC